jgi:hypothetical protein
MKITIRCGVSDGGKPHGQKIGEIDRPGFPGPRWFRGGDYDGLRLAERQHACPKHGAVYIHNEDLLRLALKPNPPVIMAVREAARDHA